jgi:hypothetical protein
VAQLAQAGREAAPAMGPELDLGRLGLIRPAGRVLVEQCL